MHIIATIIRAFMRLPQGVASSGTGMTIHLAPRLNPDGPGSARIRPVSLK
jgi:hypothetical protein